MTKMNYSRPLFNGGTHSGWRKKSATKNYSDGQTTRYQAEQKKISAPFKAKFDGKRCGQCVKPMRQGQLLSYHKHYGLAHHDCNIQFVKGK